MSASSSLHKRDSQTSGPSKAHACHSHSGIDEAAALAHGIELLKNAGHKLTRPRRACLKAIAREPRPFTTETIFNSMKKILRGTRCDLVTVYRSLATFSELGLLAQVDFGDGVIRYEMVDPKGHHHHHFICRKCARVEPLSACEVSAQERMLLNAGYTGLTHRLEFFGLCPDCSGVQRPIP